MSLTVKQRILIALLEKGPLQNNHIAQHVGITEQWCSQTLVTLHKEGLIESELKPPRKINYLTKKRHRNSQTPKRNKLKNRDENSMANYCCERSYSNIQIQLTITLRNRLNELKVPMGKRERQSRNLPLQKAWCSHWHIPIDPLEKACYKWRKANSLLLNSPQHRKVESQNNL